MATLPTLRSLDDVDVTRAERRAAQEAFGEEVTDSEGEGEGEGEEGEEEEEREGEEEEEGEEGEGEEGEEVEEAGGGGEVADRLGKMVDGRRTDREAAAAAAAQGIEQLDIGDGAAGADAEGDLGTYSAAAAAALKRGVSTGTYNALTGRATVGRCRLTVSKPVLKAPMVSARGTTL